MKPTKKRKQKNIQNNDSTAFSKQDWYGTGKRSRKRKKNKNNKVYVKATDNRTKLAEIVLENDKIVVIDTRNDQNQDK